MVFGWHFQTRRWMGTTRRVTSVRIVVNRDCIGVGVGYRSKFSKILRSKFLHVKKIVSAQKMPRNKPQSEGKICAWSFLVLSLNSSRYRSWISKNIRKIALHMAPPHPGTHGVLRLIHRPIKYRLPLPCGWTYLSLSCASEENKCKYEEFGFHDKHAKHTFLQFVYRQRWLFLIELYDLRLRKI